MPQGWRRFWITFWTFATVAEIVLFALYPNAVFAVIGMIPVAMLTVHLIAMYQEYRRRRIVSEATNQERVQV